MDWEECKNKGFVKEVKIDSNLMNSLIKSSDKKFISSERLGLDETTAPTKISIIYESLREILEAVAIGLGFKIYNHECFCSFLNEVCNEENLSKEFDRFRKIRNRINYYGKNISIGEAKILIKEITQLRKKIIEEYTVNDNMNEK